LKVEFSSADPREALSSAHEDGGSWMIAWQSEDQTPLVSDDPSHRVEQQEAKPLRPHRAPRGRQREGLERDQDVGRQDHQLPPRSDWLHHELLYAVPHRQYVFTVPKRLRPYFLYDRRVLEDLCRVACRTLREFLRATFGEAEVVPGVVASIQTFGSRVNGHPYCTESQPSVGGALALDSRFRLEGRSAGRGTEMQ
jgi:hypothetical protein